MDHDNGFGGHKRFASGSSGSPRSDPKRHKSNSPHQRPASGEIEDENDLAALLGDYPIGSPEGEEADKEKQARREAFKTKCEKVSDPVSVRDLLQSVQDGNVDADGSTDSNGSGSKGAHGGSHEDNALVKDTEEKDILLSILFVVAQRWGKPLKIFMSKNLPVICDVFLRAVAKYKANYRTSHGMVNDNRGEYAVQACIRLMKRLPIDKATMLHHKKIIQTPVKTLNEFLLSKQRTDSKNESMKEVEKDMNELLKRWSDAQKAHKNVSSSSGPGGAAAGAGGASNPPTPVHKGLPSPVMSAQSLEAERAMFREHFQYALLGQHVTGLRKSVTQGQNGGNASPKSNGPGTPNAVSRSNSHYGNNTMGADSKAGGLIPAAPLNGGVNGHGSPRHTLKLEKVVPIAEVPKGADQNAEKYKAELVAGEIEKALYNKYVGDAGAADLLPLNKDYRQHARLLASNMRHEKNTVMRHELLNTDVDLDQFVGYTSDQLAPPELKEERAKAEERMINQPIVRNIELPTLNDMANLTTGNNQSSSSLNKPQESFDEAALIKAQNSVRLSENAGADGLKQERSGSSESSGSGGNTGTGKKKSFTLTVDHFADPHFPMTPYFHHSVATPAMVFEDENDAEQLMRNLLQL